MWTLIVPLILGLGGPRMDYTREFETKAACEAAGQAIADRWALNIGPHYENTELWDQPEGVPVEWGFAYLPDRDDIMECVRSEPRPPVG